MQIFGIAGCLSSCAGAHDPARLAATVCSQPYVDHADAPVSKCQRETRIAVHHATRPVREAEQNRTPNSSRKAPDVLRPALPVTQGGPAPARPPPHAPSSSSPISASTEGSPACLGGTSPSHFIFWSQCQIASLTIMHNRCAVGPNFTFWEK